MLDSSAVAREIQGDTGRYSEAACMLLRSAVAREIQGDTGRYREI